MGKKKTGIMGGTFNPIHMGHLLLAENAKEAFGLDEILFVPSGLPYMKNGIEIADKWMRLEMTRLAVSDNPAFAISSAEVEREGNSYTWETLELFRDKEPETDHIAWQVRLQYIPLPAYAQNAWNPKFFPLLSGFFSGLKISLPYFTYPPNLTYFSFIPYTTGIFLYIRSLCQEPSLGVEYTAAALAMRYGEDLMKAQTAGLLHDCAKCMSNEKRLSICEKHNISVNKIERKNPFLLHAKVGSYIAMQKFHVHDSDTVNAILNHTTGRPDMSLLEKIIYVADYIEPGRKQAPNLTEIRKLAFTDIDEALYRILEDTLVYLRTVEGDVDPMTQKTYDFYKNRRIG